MELPRSTSRVGEFIGEHRRLALVFSVILPLGALAAKVLTAKDGVKELMATNQEVGNAANSFGERWHILEDKDLA